MQLPQKPEKRTSLVVQWLGVCLLMQGTQAQSPAEEDSIPQGTVTMEACVPWSLGATTTESHALRLLKPGCSSTRICNRRSHHNEKLGTATRAGPAHHNQRRLVQSNKGPTAKINKECSHTEKRTTIQPSSSLLGIYLRKTKTRLYKDVSQHYSQKPRHGNKLSVCQWMNKQRCGTCV